jgi:hypothetical protein
MLLKTLLSVWDFDKELLTTDSSDSLVKKQLCEVARRLHRDALSFF